MTVVDTISPHRKTELHARLLAALEEAGDADPAVLAHHAEGAGDGQAVRRLAPEAAKRSSALGAHREAAAQFERALRFTGEAGRPALAELYESLAHEYSLLDRLDESEAALRTALQHRRELGDDMRVGEDLGMLSDTLWQQCRGEESNRAAGESLRVLRSLPPGPELAMAQIGAAAGSWTTGQQATAFDGVAQALLLGKRLGRTDVISIALIMTGVFLVDSGQDGTGSIEQALQLALEDKLEQQASSAYVCLQETASSTLQRLDEAQRATSTRGMAFCERRELRTATRCMRGAQADTLLLLGRWDEAADLCAELLAIPGVSTVESALPAADPGHHPRPSRRTGRR